MLLAKALGLIVIAVAGAHIGFKGLFFLLTIFCGGFAAVSCLRLFHQQVSTHLSLIIPGDIASVISFLFLALVPLLVTVYLGLGIAKKIDLEGRLTPLSNAILGTGFASSLYLGILRIV